MTPPRVIVAPCASLVGLILAAGLLGCVAGYQHQPSSSNPSAAVLERERVADPQWDWALIDDCAPCHQLESDSIALEPCEIKLAANGPCISCHSNTQALKTVHENPLKQSASAKIRAAEANDDGCGECHSAETLIEEGDERPDLIDLNGLAVDPHLLPDTPGHADISCSDCHLPHSDQAASEVAYALCLSCHHAEVFECGTCH